MSPRVGATVGGIIGLLAGGAGGMAAASYASRNDFAARRKLNAGFGLIGGAVLGTLLGAVVGAGSCPAPAALPQTTR